MVYEHFEDALKTLNFQRVLQWLADSRTSPSIFFSIFEKIDGDEEENSWKQGNDLRLLTNDENLTGKTALHFALKARSLDGAFFEDMVSYITDKNHGENLPDNLSRSLSTFWELKDSTGRTLFENAVMLDDVAAVKKMISLGAKPEKMEAKLPNNSNAFTNILGLSVACMSTGVFRHLHEVFESCNTWDICGRRPIHLAARFGNLDALQQLIEKDYLDISSKSVQRSSDIENFRIRENFLIECYDNVFNASNTDSRNYDNESGLEPILEEMEGITADNIGSTENENRLHESMISSVGLSSPSEYEEEDLFMFDDLTIVHSRTEDSDSTINNEEEENEETNLEEDDDTKFKKHLESLEHHDSNLFHVAVDHDQYKVVSALLNSAKVRNQIHQTRADGMTALHMAAKRNNQKIIELIVANGNVSINIENDLNGAKPIHVACENGAAEAARFFLTHGCDANSEDDDGLVPLHYASKSENGAQCIDILKEYGANINYVSLEGETPVYRAISSWNLDGFWRLLKYGGDPSIPHSDGSVVLGFLASNSPAELTRFIYFCRGRTFANKIDWNAVVDEKGRTSLHIAVYNRSIDAVKALVIEGASITLCDENGMTPFAESINIKNCSRQVHEEILLAILGGRPEITSQDALTLYPLHFASQMRFHRVMRRLLDHGIDLNMQKDCMTPLHIAAGQSDVIAMKILLSRGADWKILDKNGCTPILICANEHFLEGIDILRKFGATLSDKNNKTENGMHISSLKRGPNVSATIKYFATEKGLLDMISCSGDSPIHAHIRKGRIEGVRTLVSLGCDVNILSKKDETPLMVACEAGNIPTVRILIRFGADVNIDNKNKHTAMYFFSKSENVSLRIIRLLLNNQGYINHRDKDGDTILHEAVIGNHEKITRFLIKRGIDANIRNNEGETALFIASKLGFTRIVRILLSQTSNRQLCDPKLINNNGISAYQAARVNGHSEIVTLLLNAMNFSLSTFASKSLFISEKEIKKDLTYPTRENQTSEMCIVCQEDFKNGESIRKLPCIHKFHNDCILPWIGGEEMEKSINCPICKQPLVPDRI